ncbi:MAG: hypothetical protein K1X87_10565 [Dehalococcoidia bacterium]|nr:hypothetical protein [Dehalococcoidia bacterium]
MKRVVPGGAAVVAVIALLLAQGAPRAEAATTLYVTSSADSGPGSLRDAIGTANGNSSVNLILLKNTTPITLSSYVEYTGSQALTVRGDNLLTNRVIQGASACSLFVSSGGADLTFQRVTFQDSDCSAIDVDVSDGDGEVAVTLERVLIQRVVSYGLIMSEGGPRDASMRVKLSTTTMQDIGHEAVYLYEDGPGSLTMDVSRSSILRAGGEGVFAVSYTEGDLSFTASNSSFNNNGANGLTLWTKDGASAHATLQNVHADGNEGGGVFVEDFDGGSVAVRAGGSTMSDNGASGLAVLEHDGGGVQLTLLLSWLERNGGVGMGVVEDGAGDVGFLISGSTARGNGWCCAPATDGYQLDEAGEGDLRGIFSSSIASGNGGNGYVLVEQDDGEFDVTYHLAAALGNTFGGTWAAAGGAAGVIRSIASNVGPYTLANVNVVP